MPKLQNPGQAFLVELTRYVDFRLTDKGQTEGVPRDLQGYTRLFKEFVESRPGAKDHPEMVKALVEKMSMLKTGRGTSDLRPGE